MADDTFLADLESIFATVLVEARANPVFARKLAASVAKGQTLKASAIARVNLSAEVPQTDFRSEFKNEGEEGLRKVLRAHTQRQIYVWLKSSGLSARKASAMNKSQLMEHIVLALKKESGADGKRFEY
ncbi:MAG: hypothetical protein ACOYJ6_20220 [Caulobacterales bacterium]